MDETYISQYKWFWAWQDDKQEAWLEAMSHKGLHLRRIEAFGRYIFEPGTPGDYAYRMDFDRTSGKDSDYFQLIQDAGWEHITSVMGWQYWRKKAGEGSTPELFTDAASKIQKYQRLLVSLVAPSPAIMVPIVGAFKRFPGRAPEWVVAVTLTTFTMWTLFVAVNAVMILRRINELKPTTSL
ncbi:MAG: DUF2812 domain-containing protein [Anaerolineae bacterium]|nr:DUF2812 domain-containing protein [Anaerolineae bacterium]